MYVWSSDNAVKFVAWIIQLQAKFDPAGSLCRPRPLPLPPPFRELSYIDRWIN